MHRFFLPPQSLPGDSLRITEERVIKHLSLVLRAKKDDIFLCLFNDAYEYTVQITEITKKYIDARIIEKKQNTHESPYSLVLFQSLPKLKSTFESLVVKAVEVGVTHIVPLITSRVYSNYPTDTERIQLLIKEAAEQSERGVTPKILPAINIQKSPEQFDKARTELNILTLLVADSFNKEAPLLTKMSITGSSGICVGPEGGFSVEDIQFFLSQGGKSVSLGKSILKVETAATVGVFLLKNIL